MSTLAKTNFELISNLFALQMRSEPLADPTLVNPSVATALVDGEWVTFNTANKLIRAADISSGGNAAAAPSWPVWDEKGRTDNQALADKKKTVVWLGPWEADTRVYLVTTMAVNRLVSVASVTIGGKIYSALVDNGTIGSPGSGISVGLVTKLPTANGGKLRIRGGVFF